MEISINFKELYYRFNMTPKITYCLFFLLFFIEQVFSQAPPLQWQKCYGGIGFEEGYCVQQTLDGGYVVSGAGSVISGDITGNNGLADYWIVKLDAAGAINWQKSLGGSGIDIATSIRQTPDEGYIIAGYTNSTDADVNGNHGTYDYWIVKLDADGNIEWTRVLGGSNIDQANSIILTADSGYVVAGGSNSVNGNVTGNHGIYDYWIVKLDGTGNMVWQKSFGGTLQDIPYSIQQTSDSGYILAGYSNSSNGDVTGNHGGSDCWIVKLDVLGNLVWQKSFGGTSQDHAYNIQQTTDGGYIVAGDSKSVNGNVTGNHGNYDCWILKLDAVGNLVWQKSIGGTEDDWGYCIFPVADGYIIGGNTGSDNGDASINHGLDDYWILQISSIGVLEWEKTFGGLNTEQAYSMQLASDNGFIIAGFTDSDNSGDVGDNHGLDDFWIVKLKPMGPVPVTLNRFDASVQDRSVVCTWQTLHEQNTSSFIIQRSNDGMNFKDIGQVAAAGNSSLVLNYDFTDKDAFAPGIENLYYRLKTADNDASFTYSNIVHAKINCLLSLSIYPNPVVNRLFVNFIACKNEKASISIIDYTGKKFYSGVFQVEEGNNSFPIDVSKLPAGEYVVLICERNKYLKKFIKQ